MKCSRATLAWLVIVACSFLGLPEQSAVADDSSTLVEPGAKLEKLAGGMAFTEGPVWLPAEKKLIFSDIPNSKWMQWQPELGLSVFRPSENANGNILDLQGRIIACQHGARNVVRLEADGSTTVLVDSMNGQRFNSPNDAAVHADGSLWFTDPPWGLQGKAEVPGHWVYRWDPETRVVAPVIKELAMPNGIVFSPDQSRLYVADTGGHPTHPDPAFHQLPAGIHCYSVLPTGELGDKLFTIPESSDGMTVDIQGNIYGTHGGVNIYTADGKLIERIDVPEGPANVCFGGDDYKTLYITARTSLYSIRVQQPGAKPLGASW